MGDTSRQEAWTLEAKTVLEAANALLWHDGKGVYRHGITPQGPIERLAVHDTILATYAGLAPPERSASGFSALYGNAPLDAVQIGSPYVYHFFLEALRKAGRDEMALDMIRRAYCF